MEDEPELAVAGKDRVRWRQGLALFFLVLYVVDVALAYWLWRKNWTSCWDDPNAYGLLTAFASGLLLLAVVLAVGRFEPTGLWVLSWLAALPVGYVICFFVLDFATRGLGADCPIA